MQRYLHGAFRRLQKFGRRRSQYIFYIDKCIIFCSRSVVLDFKETRFCKNKIHAFIQNIISLLSSTGFSIRFAEYPSHIKTTGRKKIRIVVCTGNKNTESCCSVPSSGRFCNSEKFEKACTYNIQVNHIDIIDIPKTAARKSFEKDDRLPFRRSAHITQVCFAYSINDMILLYR